MSRPLKKTPKTKEQRKERTKKILELPDDKAIRKLFPPKLIDAIDKRIGREKKK